MIRIGLIGFGFASQTFHLPLIGTVPGLAVTAVASSRTDEVRSALPDAHIFAKPEDMLASDRIDVAVVASPSDSHVALATMALQAGKHVVVEKPFALDLATAKALVTEAGKNDRILSIFHNRRWDSDFLSVRRAIEEGRIGTVTHFESHFDRFRPEVRDRWREKKGDGSGIWNDLGPHLIDQALLLFGMPVAVQADLAALRPGATIDDWAHVLLIYKERRVLLHASMLVAGGAPRFIAHGTAGSLIKSHADRQETQLIAGLRPGAPEWGVDPDDLRWWDADGHEHRQPAERGSQESFYRDLHAALSGQGENPVTGQQALQVTAVLEAARQSSEQGRTIELQADLADL